MAVPSAPNVFIGGNHKWGSDGVAAITTTPSESVTKVTAIISQTSGGAAIETVETSTKTSSDQFADRWALSWPTEDITSSPYYVRVRSTNADGNGPFKEIAPYIYFPPAVAVTAPVNGSTLASASVTVAWTASDPYGISAQRVTVLHGADVLLDETVSESATSYAVPSSVAFLDGESYTFRVTARNGNGMEASADSTCAFSFDAPAAASVTIADDGATATIAVDDPHYSESGATISVDGSAIADSFTVYGASVQDGTPTPSTPVAIESIGSRNLSPFFSHDLTDVYNVSTNPTGYWNVAPTDYFTQKPDGWAHVSIDNTGGGSAVTARIRVAGQSNTTALKPSTKYTFLVEVKDAVVGGNPNSNGNYAQVFANNTSWSSSNFFNTMSAATLHITEGGNAKASVVGTTKSSFSGLTYMCQSILNVYAGASIECDLRLSIYEGEYTGLYEEVGCVSVGSVGRNVVYGALTPSGGTFINGSTGALVQNKGTQTYMARVEKNTDYTLSYDGGNRCVIAGFQTATPVIGAVGSVIFNNSSAKESPKTFNTGNFEYIALYVATSAAPASNVMLEAGPTATPYQPYEGTTYPIDISGNSLRSLPDGTCDELRVGERVVLIKRCGETMQAVTDGVTGTVGVDVLSSTGQIADDAQVIYKLAAPQEIDLGAASDYPFIPEDGEMWVDGTTMEASLRPADYAGQPPISSVDIARVNPDGTWTLAQGVTEGQSAIDPLPPLGVPYRYALTSHAAGGGTKVAYVEHTVETRAWHLNFGNAAQEHVSYLYNPQATMTLAQGGESYHFADGGAGRGLPVFYPTTDRDMSGTLRFDTVLYGDSDILLDLCDRYPVAWLRDPFGHRWRAHVRPSVSHGTGQVWPVTIAWDAVRFEEV